MADPATERFLEALPQVLAELERRATDLFDLSLRPDAASLPALEHIADFLWQMAATFNEMDRRVNVLLLGAYLGELVRRERGGRWRVDAALGLPVIDLPDGQVFSPMKAVGQRLSAGQPTLDELRFSLLNQGSEQAE